MRKGETVDKFDKRVSYTITEDRSNGMRTTFILVHEIASVQCTDITVAKQGRKLMLRSQGTV